MTLYVHQPTPPSPVVLKLDPGGHCPVMPLFGLQLQVLGRILSADAGAEEGQACLDIDAPGGQAGRVPPLVNQFSKHLDFAGLLEHKKLGGGGGADTITKTTNSK